MTAGSGRNALDGAGVDDRATAGFQHPRKDGAGSCGTAAMKVSVSDSRPLLVGDREEALEARRDCPDVCLTSTSSGPSSSAAATSSAGPVRGSRGRPRPPEPDRARPDREARRLVSRAPPATTCAPSAREPACYRQARFPCSRRSRGRALSLRPRSIVFRPYAPRRRGLPVMLPMGDGWASSRKRWSA